MLISGVQNFTLLDYPGKVACIVFTAGCNFRCGYCHNPEFVLPGELAKLKSNFIPESVFFNFLLERQGLLEGVVISGGEPTLMPDLLKFMRKIKLLGFLVKLDTNGNNPRALEQAIAEKLVDFIAMDVKASLAGYKSLVGALCRPENIKKSIAIIMNSEVNYEFRSTLVKEFHSKQMLKEMSRLIIGAENYYLQTFRPAHTLNQDFTNYSPYSREEMNDIINIFKLAVKNVAVR